MTDEELAAVIAAVQAVLQPEEAPAPRVGTWKRTARLEAVGVQ